MSYVNLSRHQLLDIWSLGSRTREKKQRKKVGLLCFLCSLCFLPAEKKQRDLVELLCSLCFFSADKKQREQRKQSRPTFFLCFFSLVREPRLYISRARLRSYILFGGAAARCVRWKWSDSYRTKLVGLLGINAYPSIFSGQSAWPHTEQKRTIGESCICVYIWRIRSKRRNH